MSFSFSGLLAWGKTALSTVAADAAPILQAGEALAPVISLIPGAGPIIAQVEAGAASIATIAPTAVADATAVFTAGEKIVSDMTPELTQLEAAFESIFHVNALPGGTVVLTPKTSSATVPVTAIPASPTAPGPALS